MRETATYIRCDGDGCSVMAKVVSDAETPQGWLRVWEAKEGSLAHAKNGSHSFDLCSLRCVEKWAKGRRAFLGDITPRRDSEHRSRILALFESDPDAILNVTDIADLTNCTGSATRHHLKRMADNGDLELISEGKPRHPARYRLRQAAQV